MESEKRSKLGSLPVAHTFFGRSRNAITMGMGDLNMADMVQGALFILACAFLYGLTVFLFRDQIKSRG